MFTSSFASNDLGSQTFNPSLNGFSPPAMPVNGDMPLPLDFSTPSGSDFANMLNPGNGMQQTFADGGDIQQPFGGSVGTSFSTESFQQPFVPQDLWQMPMTLEWDWADMGYPSVGADGQ